MSMKLVRKNSVIAPMDRLRVPKIRPLTDDQIAEMKVRVVGETGRSTCVVAVARCEGRSPHSH